MSRQLFAAERQFAAVAVEDAARRSYFTQRFSRLRKNSVFLKGTGFSRYINPAISTGLYRLRKNSGPDRKDVPQGLKPDVFSIIYGTTKVVP